MAKIVRRTRDGAEEIELGSFQLTIGRRPDSNVVIDNAYTALQHAVVGFADGRHYIEDLKTTHGTRVNGAAVRQAPLRHGDIILIGLQRLEFIDPPVARTPPPAPLRRPAVAPAPVIAAPQPSTPSGPFDLPLLTSLPDAPAERLQPADPAPGGLLDQLVGSIRSHREREQQEREDAQARLRGEWNQAVAYAEQLRLKVDGDPRVHYFAISRRNNDIIIRSQRAADLPVTFTQLSMDHPEDKGHALTGIWLRRTGQADRCYPTAKDAVSELVRELAYLIA
ncbi:FHA domain-containing protein [Solimonas sp. SE-A11]|uniref:FHA domain-containing protein n=1 Tax=Solimonas sp. SE-A11 TaxID=3054954 RepID=UPI00259C8315|nr:FHA domain-containing protein [Solimonas sp. SE-A11]MDM4770341.1 FHA domain-containing protein [Solimonas sp. SE-A11]